MLLLTSFPYTQRKEKLSSFDGGAYFYVFVFDVLVGTVLDARLPTFVRNQTISFPVVKLSRRFGCGAFIKSAFILLTKEKLFSVSCNYVTGEGKTQRDPWGEGEQFSEIENY